jgi:hypothetical protein
MNGHSLVVVSPGVRLPRSARSERNPLAEENQKLRRQNAGLTEDLRKAQLIIDVQKEVAALLGSPLPDVAGFGHDVFKESNEEVRREWESRRAQLLTTE